MRQKASDPTATRNRPAWFSHRVCQGAVIGLWVLLIGSSHADINPSFTPTWSIGDRWQVEASSFVYSFPKVAGVGKVIDDVGTGPVFLFEVAAVDAVHYVLLVSSVLDPDEFYRLFVRRSDFTLQRLERIVHDDFSGQFLVDRFDNPAPASDFVLFTYLAPGTPLDFPNMPATNVDETRMITLDDSSQQVTQSVVFGAGGMTIQLSTLNNGEILQTTMTWDAGAKWWTLAERHQGADLVSSGELIVDEAPDSDGDGLDDGTETIIGTNVLTADSDGDGLSDFHEHVWARSDPLAAGDSGSPSELYSVSPDDNLLRRISSADGATGESIGLTLAGETILGANGLARHPVSGQLFALLHLSSQSGMELVTVDPDSGSCTRLGNTGDELAAIAFDSAGTLFAVSDDGAVLPETLFTLSTADSTRTFLVSLGNGTAGEALAFNPDDGLLYHASGAGAQNVDAILETIDPNTLAVTSVVLSGDVYSEATALLCSGGGVCLVADDAGELFDVTTTGVVSALGATSDHVSKGLAFVSSPPRCSVFGRELVAVSGTAFSWGDRESVHYVRGHLDEVGSYGFDLERRIPLATTVQDEVSPVDRAGFFYLVKPECPGASWQTTPGSESDRDAALP